MNFEEAGRAVDQELAALKDWLNKNIEPGTKREMATNLRRIARRLEKLADKLQSSKR
jgi:hypothetical protein